MSMTAAHVPVWPLLVYFAGVLAVVAGMLGISFVLGGRHKERTTDVPYESGMMPTGSARVRLVSDFFPIAIFFVVFDLESVFVVTWAIAVRETGWPGYLGVSVFIAALVAAWVYLWRKRALDF